MVAASRPRTLASLMAEEQLYRDSGLCPAEKTVEDAPFAAMVRLRGSAG